MGVIARPVTIPLGGPIEYADGAGFNVGVSTSGVLLLVPDAPAPPVAPELPPLAVKVLYPIPTKRVTTIYKSTIGNISPIFARVVQAPTLAVDRNRTTPQLVQVTFVPSPGTAPTPVTTFPSEPISPILPAKGQLQVAFVKFTPPVGNIVFNPTPAGTVVLQPITPYPQRATVFPGITIGNIVQITYYGARGRVFTYNGRPGRVTVYNHRGGREFGFK